MSTPRKTRGEWRPLYESLVTHPTFLSFSRDAKLVFYTLRLSCGAVGIKAWPGLDSALSELTGIPLKSVPKAIAELVLAGWVMREGPIVWITEALENEPQLSHGEKHIKFVVNAIAGLPSCTVVTAFKQRYAEFLPASHRVSDSLSHTLSDSLSHGVSGTTPQPQPLPHPQPHPLPPPQPTTCEDEQSVQQRGRWLVVAANKGIAETYGEQPRPIIAASTSSYKAITEIHAAGVDFEFATAEIFEYAKTVKPSDGRLPQHLGYFTQYVVKKWQQAEAKREADNFTPGVRAIGARKESNAFHAYAIGEARAGNPEYLEYCRDHNIDWEQAA